MTNEPDFDQTLRRDFQRLREDDGLRTPDFGAMLARARADVAAAPPMSAPVAPSVTPWLRSGRRVLLVGAPLAAAAALGIWFRPTNAADREFEQAVAAYSQTAARTSTSPTDGLLAVPGTEFLRGTPIDGMVARTPRRGS
jgi:ferric-dicitrate binding protein FerR (iron transport regulator)